MGFPAMGGRQQKHPGPDRLGQIAKLHEFAFSGQSRNCKSVAKRLAPGRQIGLNAVFLLCGITMQAEPGDHLVQDE